MKTTDALLNKNILINQINKVFDRKTIERLSIENGFIVRERVLKAWDFFFFVCFPINAKME
jgi:hypothetical protein